MKERFLGDGHANLIESLKRQPFIEGSAEIAQAFSAAGSVEQFKPGETLIVEGGEDNDVYLLLAGTVSAVIKGQEVRTLKAGQHAGEMAAVEPGQPRSATIIAEDTVVALKVPGNAFAQLGDRFPTVWKPIARELAFRLYDRNRHMTAPNEKPKLLILSSAEALDVAREIQSALAHDVLCVVWTDGIFWAGGYPLEALETAVNASDFGVAVAEFEDIVESRGERRPTIRDNVLFELGMFMGKLGRRRTILVHPRHAGLKLPSDLHGITPAVYDPGRDDLRARLGPACNEIRKVIRERGVRTAGG
jgi:predicted nucleotide-binding protein